MAGVSASATSSESSMAEMIVTENCRQGARQTIQRRAGPA